MEDGKSIRAAAEDNNIPRETLTQWAKNPPSHFGNGSKRSTLSTEQEELIVVGSIRTMFKDGMALW